MNAFSFSIYLLSIVPLVLFMLFMKLDDPVAKYFPEFENHLVYNAEDQVEAEKTPLAIQNRRLYQAIVAED